ncbi:MAG TPA: imidazole glycerol phosphate synthase subunit HisH [Patescibacteria group bacterium]|nr:imidazole glycerol phosphate synthase subunit HisH [Patescibacteria group bacterium]
MTSVAVVDYGVGNLFSMTNALRRTGLNVDVTGDPEMIRSADAIVLPGVGNFGAAATRLQTFSEPIHGALAGGVPVLGSCLGMQLLFEGSEESLEKGLGLLSGEVRKFQGDMKIPHMGWNTITAVRDSPLLKGIPDNEYFYFVHSFYPEPEEPGDTLAVTDYGGRFTSIVERGTLYGTQFHPEKSGRAGAALLSNFARIVRGAKG